uniref:MADF domain-containing protein n=1 Tax=Angiostrongylus cantonensis TaxID=6313 RepID=A0A0K0D1N0_ANGCA
MEVAGAHPRRQQSAAPQASSQNSSTRTAEYQLTELKNVPTRSAKVVTNDFEQGEKAFPTIESSIDDKLVLNATASESESRDVADEDFHLRLINAVRENPCLYDPLNEFYRDKPENNKFRMRVWDRIAEELNWQSDLNLLIDEWDRLRDQYIQKKTDRGEDAAEQLCPSGSLLAESMQWIDEYIFEDALAALSTQSHLSLSPANAQDVYFNEVNHDVMISGYQQPTPTLTSHRRLSQSESHSGGYHILLRQSSPTGGETTIRLVTGPTSGPESAARNSMTSVISTISSFCALMIVRLCTSLSILLSKVHAPPSSSSQFIQKIGHEGVTVTATGSAGMIGNVKKDTMTMVVDPTTFYTNGAQKMYRLVNVSDMVSGVNPPPRKRIAVIPKSTAQSSQQSASLPNQSPPLSMTSGANPISSGGQLGDDIIIDDGIEERTVVIEQHDSDSPLLGDSPLSTMMVSGHQAVPRGSSHQSRHMQLSMVDHLRSQTRAVSTSPQHHSPSLGSGYLQQSQYDADLQFQQFISQNLSILNDDEKAIAKMHIQKILMDARFGQGTCLRLMQEEEIAAHADTGGPSGARDGSRSLDI